MSSLSLKVSYARCGHCDKLLSSKAIKEHKRLYFHDGVWLKSQSKQDEQGCGYSSPISGLSSSSSDTDPDISTDSQDSLPDITTDYIDEPVSSKEAPGK